MKKKVIIILCVLCIILVFLLSLIFGFFSKEINNVKKVTTTTSISTTTTTTRINKELKEDEYSISINESKEINDELKIEFLYSYHDGLYSNLMNDSSLVFKITGKEKSVLFLGDLGPEGGDYLYRENRDNLKSDIVQMAHHGHMNVSLEVYAKINPKICLWCAPIWLYEEKEIPDWMTDEWLEKDKKRYRMYGTKVTREWMELLGVKEHLVTGYGTQEFEI